MVLEGVCRMSNIMHGRVEQARGKQEERFHLKGLFVVRQLTGPQTSPVSSAEQDRSVEIAWEQRREASVCVDWHTQVIKGQK